MSKFTSNFKYHAVSFGGQACFVRTFSGSDFEFFINLKFGELTDVSKRQARLIARCLFANDQTTKICNEDNAEDIREIEDQPQEEIRTVVDVILKANNLKKDDKKEDAEKN